jgi:hypothetical protein
MISPLKKIEAKEKEMDKELAWSMKSSITVNVYDERL